jgi:hypothetical protein
LLNRAISGPARSLIQASMTSGSWNKLNSALHCFSQFESARNQTSTLPLSDEVLCDFVSWVILSRGLKTSTAKTYLSNLSTIHELRGFGRVNCFQALTKRVLKGAENIAFYRNVASESRRVMTLPLLKLLGHEISRSSWSKTNKQVFWSACTTAFFGSFRFGEILAPTEWAFNSHETLLWSDVNFSHDSVLIHVKISKNRSRHGEYIDLFPFPGHNCCPMKSLARLRDLNPDRRPGDPVFQFDSGKLLTSGNLNLVLGQLLKPHLGEQAKRIQGHSFRAAIPSALANNPDLAGEDDIKSWGRWSSDSFRLYTRLQHNQKRIIFNKITSALNV